VPVELVPFAAALVLAQLAALGAHDVALRRTPDHRDFITDNANLIADARFGPIADPATLEAAILAITGVIDCGLFINRTNEVLVGTPNGIHRLLRT